MILAQLKHQDKMADAISHSQAAVGTVAYRGRGLGCSNPPLPKFWRYRWSPRSHKQEEPTSRFPFV